ncbi:MULTISPECIES: 3'-5' exonuclease family protein [unclassified Halomonas]|uniref:3'-5' exonuclease family protein n=1 Tax=unclassified Halomonas TaxID=2609666 RepID=UPI0007D9B80B|nr:MULTISPECIES: 3'-5' exonuclease family protein [unclassified Halomonas]MBT2787859.1 3'-5' exoribonuclease [Halomonas sp. ISL-106]MBT2795608.1 3'-5' exoribonuclease [Halomonas sp. ISL-104]OAL60917.1 DNA polymerase III subunit epsilon [Halomonas sp. ALS9]
MSETALIFIDVETTGTRATRDRITEIAALKVINGELIDRWSSLIYPECKVPAQITQLTGIRDDMLVDAPRFAKIAESLREWLGDGQLVAHNARFDYSFLRNEFKRAGQNFRASLICTLRLSRRIAPLERQHNLKALLNRYGITPIRHHRAGDDVDALWSLWQAWQVEHSDEAWQSLLGDERRHRSLPAHLDSAQLEGLPTCPGVYLFYGHNRLPLYVGKSINLRSRVLGHFQRDHQDDKEMRLAQQVQHIEWEETAGDLGAQLREAQLVKTLMPIMNRQLRKQRKLTSWHWGEAADHPELVSGSALGQALSEPLGGMLYGLFRSALEAKNALRAIAEEQQLCPRVLGLEKGKGRCFANQVGKCRGACNDQETIAAHTQRAKAALRQLQVNVWPWPGSIAIEERPSGDAKPAWHVVRQWCYLGSAKSLKQAQSLMDTPGSFDVDSYRILNRFLRSPEQHGLTVTPL